MLSREDVGRVVRETWEAWAREQPDIAEHPSWLVPWESLPERDREVDMRIGDAVVSAVYPKLRADVERLTRELAEARRVVADVWWLVNNDRDAKAMKRIGDLVRRIDGVLGAPAIRAAEGET